MTNRRTYNVPGVHCAHCQRAIVTEVAQVAGVNSVQVDLASKHVTVEGSRLDDQKIREAIDDAGYEAVP